MGDIISVDFSKRQRSTAAEEEMVQCSTAAEMVNTLFALPDPVMQILRRLCAGGAGGQRDSLS